MSWSKCLTATKITSSLHAIAALRATLDGSGDQVGLLTAVRATGDTLIDLQAVTGFAYSDGLAAAAAAEIERREGDGLRSRFRSHWR